MEHESRRDGFLISTDRSLIDLEAVHSVLSNIYWSKGIPKEIVWRGIEGSITFGVYNTIAPQARSPGKQVGFARVITDAATFAYLSDVYVIDEYRGRGLSKWLMEVILAHPQLQGLRRFCLLTRDAHGLYARYGFKGLDDPKAYMEITVRDIYLKQ
jgi:GNAT superfamily N-acetyltransferase